MSRPRSAHPVDRPFETRGRTAVVATMHGKERVIIPALAPLGLAFLPCPAIDTDRFGTFTRDIRRAGSQRAALDAKARAGLAAAPGADYAVASEGAFGPHPAFPFIPSGFELVGLLERQSGAMIVGRYLSLDTNFRQAQASTIDEVEAFAQAIGFPGHAIVLMAGRDGPIIAKGVSDRSILISQAQAAIECGGSVWLEADMRANRNPQRMASISLAVQELLSTLTTRCPACDYPGWTPQTKDGRPCLWCENPTFESWIEVRQCGNCGHQAERCLDADRRAEPGLCLICNP